MKESIHLSVCTAVENKTQSSLDPHSVHVCAPLLSGGKAFLSRAAARSSHSELRMSAV